MSEKISTSDDPLFERHRPYLRRLEKAFSSVYGYGGTLIFLLGVLLPLACAWKFHFLTAPLLYIGIVLAVGVGFALLRVVVKKKRNQLRRAFSAYCEINELDSSELLEKIREDETYGFVVALFESRPGEDRQEEKVEDQGEEEALEDH